MNCPVPECSREIVHRGYCRTHYLKFRREGKITVKRRRANCSVEGCLQPHYGKGLCETHWYRVNRHGDAHVQLRRRKGEGTVNRDGYKVIVVDGVRVLEHRKVMEDILRRPLRDDENVHHRNGDRLDNRPENLELWSKAQPAGQRVSEKLAWAREILALYGHLEQP